MFPGLTEEQIEEVSQKLNIFVTAMNYIRFLLQNRGLYGTTHRFGTILKRFDFSGQKIENSLNRLLEITQAHDTTLSLPITAVTLNRNAKLVQRLAKKGVEFAVHGYVHTDYTQLGRDVISDHIQKAVEIFQYSGITHKGFRSPYLRWNDEMTKTLGGMGFTWSSSQTILWDVLKKNEFRSPLWDNYEKVVKSLYEAKDSVIYPALPHKRDGVTEIPVSLPDDEILVDRLGIHNAETLNQIWGRILDETYQRGELFVIQLHHERIPIFSETIHFLLDKAKRMKPKVWIASLNDIADWWDEKRAFKIRVFPGEKGYDAEVDCSERAWVLLKHQEDNASRLYPQENTSIQNQRMFRILTPRKPVIGIPPQTSNTLIEFLTDEGFPYEKSNNRNDYAIYLEGFENFEPSHRRQILGLIEKTKYPVVRFSRWPKGYRSALTVTGDIDCMTLTDFFLRPFEI